MGKSGGEIQVSEHYMSIHMGVCASGPDLELLAIKIGDKEAWRGKVSRNKVLKIDKPELFGGNQREGGAKGMAWWLNGNEKQVLPGPLRSRLSPLPNPTIEDVPGFRGLASLFFTGFRHPNTLDTTFFWPDFEGMHDDSPLAPSFLGDLVNGQPGFHWSSNNPYLKDVAVRVRRVPQGLNPSIAMIRLPDDSNGNEQWAANAAHIVFEAMTNRDWGMGESFGAMDIGSYEECAQTLYDEKFGLNIIWTRQSKIEDFIKEVLDHIQGAQFVNPETGKHTLKLLRAVDPEIEVPLISPDNATLSGFKMKAWGDISNEIVVTWTNPETSKEETVTAQDLAAIGMQGAQPASDSRNYYGIASQELAIQVAERDLAAVVHPIITCEATVTKEFWRTVVYDVIEMHWPERGIESSFFRVSSVGLTKDNRVKMNLYEDIFSLERASYLVPESTGWVDDSADPAPLDNYYIGTAPAFMTAAALGLTDPSELTYPEALTALIVPPDDRDDVSYELIGYTTTVLGDTVQQSFGDRRLLGSWISVGPIAAQASSVIPQGALVRGLMPASGDFLIIGGPGDALAEIAVVRSANSSGYTLDRGILDTVPRAWPAGTRIWVVPALEPTHDITRRSAFETASYHFRTRTSKGVLALEDAPKVDVVLSERPHLPNRPANVKVSGVGFGTVDIGTNSTALVTWSRRNRVNESTQVMVWTDGDMAPEAGQTTRIYIMRADRTPITTISDIVGTSASLTRANFAGNTSAIVRVVSVRAGMESLQGHEIAVIMDADVDVLGFSGDETGNTLELSGDMAPGNLIV